MTSLLGVPIQVGQQLFGVLYLCNRKDKRPFDEQDAWLVETMAGYAALAIAGTYLREQQNRLTLLEERERIGMELHDGVIQSLYAIGMQLDLLRMTETSRPDDLKPIISGLNAVIEDIRHFILNLKSRNQHQKTTFEYFTNMVDRLHVPAQLHVEIEAPHDHPPFTPAIFESICLIANEAISNVVRHAHATVLKITVRQDRRLFEIMIADNGGGFDLADVNQQGGLGLSNIQQRARIYGGQIHVESAPGQGTTINITIPI